MHLCITKKAQKTLFADASVYNKKAQKMLSAYAHLCITKKPKKHYLQMPICV